MCNNDAQRWGSGGNVTAFPHTTRARKYRRATAFRRTAISAIAGIVFLALPGARAQTNASQDEKASVAPSGSKENGKKLFVNNGCYECHGREGQGAVQATGPRIGPPQLSFEAFVKYLHHPTGQMPPYTSKVISDQELADVYAYLQSKPKAAASKDIPLLNQ
jgi:mono/diheme cytochrome c family protein